MARQVQEDSPPRTRHRANTSSFGLFLRRKDTSTPASPPHTPLTVPALVDALTTPSSAPNLAYARSLAHQLPTHSPLPPCTTLLKILQTFCDNSASPLLQVAGFEILSAYWENQEACSLGTADRLIYFSLFLGSPVAWSKELWEPRFKALRSLSKFGTEIVGNEVRFLDLLKGWINGAFEGLGGDHSEDVERERSIGILAEFLTGIADNQEIAARVPAHVLASVVQFYATLVDKYITPVLPTQPPELHRRHPSSISIQSANPVQPKTSGDIATKFYLAHLQRSRHILPTSLPSVLPVLFRALASSIQPLPRLSAKPVPAGVSSPIQSQLTEFLSKLLTGPLATSSLAVLKKYLLPPPSPSARTSASPPSYLLTTLGAHRTLRNHIRRTLTARLARAYIDRQASLHSTHAGVPGGGLDVVEELMGRAYNLGGWDAARIGPTLADSVLRWIEHEHKEEKEHILTEVSGTIKDIFQELDERDDDLSVLDYDEGAAVGQTLYNLASYLLQWINADETPYTLNISQSHNAPPVLRTLASLLVSRPSSSSITPPLSATLLLISAHLPDATTASLPTLLPTTPTHPEWLTTWARLLSNRAMVGDDRPVTTKAVMECLWDVYENVRDMDTYRRSLADVVLDYAKNSVCGDVGTVWRILGDEIVMRDPDEVQSLLELLTQFACTPYVPLPQSPPYSTGESTSRSPSLSTATPTPMASRSQSAYRSVERDGRVMSIFSSLTSNSRAPSYALPTPPTPSSAYPPILETPPPPLSLGAVNALISTFSQLVFTPAVSAHDPSVALALTIFDTLLRLVPNASTEPRVALAILEFIMRIRADRDHRVFYPSKAGQEEGARAQIDALALSIGRIQSVVPGREDSLGRKVSGSDAVTELRRARARMPRGRSTSRAGRSSSQTKVIPKEQDSLWILDTTSANDQATFPMDTPSECLITYDSDGPDRVPVLPISRYLGVLCDVLEGCLEESRRPNVDPRLQWELTSYILVHLPSQLTNKHLWCGPMSRQVVVRLLSILCSMEGNPGWGQHPNARSLLYPLFTILISYRRSLSTSPALTHALVGALRNGLDVAPRLCLSALSLAAFEIPVSVTKHMPEILDKLSRIMSSPAMAVHILAFLNMVGAEGAGGAMGGGVGRNFREAEWRKVFGVALQYLQHHNRPGEDQDGLPFDLAQHVRILSFGTMYVWFLSLKLADRPQHVPYITRQLLLAGRVDDATEVCFDWLARYTYASADPRPAKSLLSDIVVGSSPSANEKTWIVANSVMTIRTLPPPRAGWIEVLSRRPSGYTRFLCRLENAPMVGPGDAGADLVSIGAALVEGRSPPAVRVDDNPEHDQVVGVLTDGELAEDEEALPRPDPITGYVWSKTAPSQRRKDVAVDPAFLALQLSSYPAPILASPSSSFLPPPAPLLVNPTASAPSLPRFLATLDRLPVIDTHKVGVLYVAPSQTTETQILLNTHGSPAYTRFLSGLGRLIDLRGQIDVYAGGLNPNEDGAYAYAWWDDIGQILWHVTTMMPNSPRRSDEDEDEEGRGCESGEGAKGAEEEDILTAEEQRAQHAEAVNRKKSHVGNDFVRVVWNDSGAPYSFDTLRTQFQFVNIVISPHSPSPNPSTSTPPAPSTSPHENAYFQLTLQRAPGMAPFSPLCSAETNGMLVSEAALPVVVRRLCLLADWYAVVFAKTHEQGGSNEAKTNWMERLAAIRRFRQQYEGEGGEKGAPSGNGTVDDGVMDQQGFRDFTTAFG